MTKAAKRVLDEAEDGLHSLSDLSTEAVDAIRGLMKDVRDETLELVQSGRDQIDEFGGTVSKAVRKRPLQSVGIALGIGCLIGIVFRR
jgi:ElaB/YqjD/DUF883 family membrane-anchored ribosome-binding protein